jgi:hypothetical protein
MAIEQPFHEGIMAEFSEFSSGGGFCTFYLFVMPFNRPAFSASAIPDTPAAPAC